MGKEIYEDKSMGEYDYILNIDSTGPLQVHTPYVEAYVIMSHVIIIMSHVIIIISHVIIIMYHVIVIIISLFIPLLKT